MASSTAGGALTAADAVTIRTAVATMTKGKPCQVQPVSENPPASRIKHGEMEFDQFGGHRAKYLIAPKDLENPDDIIRWMFTSPNGWKMKAPSLIVSCYGGRDHYMHWANSKTLKNRSAWTNGPDYKFQATFKGRLGEISAGVCQAVTECGGWFELGHGGRGGLNEVICDGIKVYWSAFGTLAGHKEKNTLFSCRFLDETAFADLFEDCAVPIVGSRSSEDTGGSASSLKSEKVFASANPAITKRVLYPSVDSELYPELGMEQQTEQPPMQDVEDDHHSERAKSAAGTDFPIYADDLKFAVVRRFLCKGLTHIVFVQNKQLRDKLFSKLFSLATRATIFANGRKELITPGIEGKILNDAMAGVPVICLHNTGGAAEMLGAAVHMRRNPSDVVRDSRTKEIITYDYKLPENVPDDQFLILNPAKDSVEKVINKLTLVLSTSQDSEMTEVGYAKAEQTRIAYAWELYALFKHNAKKFRRRARFIHYLLTFLSVGVTALSVVHGKSKHKGQDGQEVVLGESGQELGEAGRILARVLHIGPNLIHYLIAHDAQVKASLVVIPVVSTFFLTINSRLNPLGKWADVESGAVRVQSEIYQYRCRVAEYAPRTASALDIEDKVDNLCDTFDYNLAGMSDESMAASQKKKKTDAQKVQPVARRIVFAKELEAINSQTVGSDLRLDSLEAPTVNDIKAIYGSMFDSRRAAEEYERWNSGITGKLRSCFRCCGRRSKRNDDEVGSDDPSDSHGVILAEDENDYVQLSGSDFLPNPNHVEDDYLRDDGVQLITAEDYIHFRLQPVLHHLNRRAAELTVFVNFLQIMVFFLTGLLASATVLHFEEWVPVIVALITSISNTLEFENFSIQLRNINQSLELLKNLRMWWQSCSMVERRMPANKEIIVSTTEATVDCEISAWKKTLKAKKPAGSGADSGAKKE